MPKIVWSKRYKINVDKLDDQHRHMAELVNVMNDKIEALDDRDAIVKGFKHLIKYTKGHFVTEETLMKKHGFPDRKKHRKEHKELVNLLLDIERQFRGKSKSFSNFDYDLAKDWLVIYTDWFAVHLVHSDKALGSFLIKKGIK